MKNLIFEKRFLSIEKNIRLLIRKIESLERFKSATKLKKSKSLVKKVFFFLINNYFNKGVIFMFKMLKIIILKILNE